MMSRDNIFFLFHSILKVYDIFQTHFTAMAVRLIRNLALSREGWHCNRKERNEKLSKIIIRIHAKLSPEECAGKAS